MEIELSQCSAKCNVLSVRGVGDKLCAAVTLLGNMLPWSGEWLAGSRRNPALFLRSDSLHFCYFFSLNLISSFGFSS